MTTIIRGHHDADGITSAYFTAYGVRGSKMEIWDGAFGDTTGLKAGDWMVDMKPIQNLEGLNVIDHHLPHPEDRKYNLVVSNRPEPATLLCWEYFKDSIPKDQWWKVAIGVNGDGQPELIPPEVFEEHPILLQNWKTSIYNRYSKWTPYYVPLYKLLSSGINALLRKHDMESAINVMRFSNTPRELLNDDKVIRAKAQVSAEFKKITETCDSYSIPYLDIYLYKSNFRMTGYVAQTMGSSTDRTTMAINTQDGSGSLRGSLSGYIKYKTRHLDYLTLDGHPGFMGMKIKVGADVFVKDLISIL